MSSPDLPSAQTQSERISVASLCSPSTPQQPKNYGINHLDEDVLIAVKALGDMRSGSGLPHHHRSFTSVASTSASVQPTPSLSRAATSISYEDSENPHSPRDENPSVTVADTTFVSRVTHLPYVNTAIRAYTQGKASSRVVKYGAEMVESSVKSISRPVIDRLPANLDEFACRQLDRLGRYGRPEKPKDDDVIINDEDSSMTPLDDRAREEIQAEVLARWMEHRDHGHGGFSRETSVGRDFEVESRGLSHTNGDSPSYAASTAGDTEASADIETDRSRDAPSNAAQGDSNQNQVATRSKWQAVLLEAGGLSAAVSEESMRRLKYCLQWLQYATSHIDRQILLLRSFIESISPPQDPASSQQDPDALVPIQSMQTLTEVKRDLVSTIRQVVDVVSKYAGGTLPEPARSTVRSFILKLPERWAVAARAEAAAGSGANATNGTSAGAGSRRSRSETEAQERQSRPTASAATQAAQRVLTLATESLDTMRSVTGVFKDSLDRAEAWVERLRMVGIQRQQSQTQDAKQGNPHPISPSPPSPVALTSGSLAALSLARGQSSMVPTNAGGDGDVTETERSAGSVTKRRRKGGWGGWIRGTSTDAGNRSSMNTD
ncbi:hypothetical protein BOTBODRAFT_28564 [Botryobasidium botryosum FD-172 SS1]|uniref:Opi1-domain-containing protein n=1 Tax=Botryobasidium botryosum (strain FD-172 SS1) TaxID=930990 RepID=A0A067MTY2_BOTB1|nr:hypothetical protein BOTBODRAFT_28564 [Botryobasidium botryosum FD-172 SS1]